MFETTDPLPWQRQGKARSYRATICTFVLATMLPCISPPPSRGDDFSNRDLLFTRLSTSMTSIQDGKPFREALGSIAGQVELNLWLDRMIDPTAPVEAGPVGPTVAAALQKIAARRGCVIMPAANVVLVGRPTWVDSTAASLLSLELDGDPAALADIRWPSLITPGAALKLAADQNSVDVTPPLDHDLWPATHWTQIDRRVAVTLVLAQLDRRPRSTSSLVQLTTEPAHAGGTFSRRYSSGPETKAIREAMTRVDRRSSFRVRDGWLEARGSAAAHRAAAEKIFAMGATAARPDPENDTRTFDLKQPVHTSAENALRQFAAAANKACEIHPSAAEACKKMVTLEAKKNTLRELIDKVAQQAGVVVSWERDRIVIRSK